MPDISRIGAVYSRIRVTVSILTHALVEVGFMRIVEAAIKIGMYVRADLLTQGNKACFEEA